MTIDVVCTGHGLPRPDLRRARTSCPRTGASAGRPSCTRRPGGAATTAIGITRLGLRPPWSPRSGATSPGGRCAPCSSREGVLCAGPEAERTPVTVVLPFAGDRAMVTFEPRGRHRPRDDRAPASRAPSSPNAAQLDLVPDGVAGYATVGDSEAGSLAQHLPAELGRLRALLDERPGGAAHHRPEPTPEAAARALAEHVETAVVSRGAAGAVAASGGELVTASAPTVEARTRRGRATCSSPPTSPGT